MLFTWNIRSFAEPDQSRRTYYLDGHRAPANGTYAWIVNAGGGSLSGTGQTAIFTGDQRGKVEIKVSYTPPEGGEGQYNPCDT